MINPRKCTIIVEYLLEKCVESGFLKENDNWLTTPHDAFFGKTPYQVIQQRQGYAVIEWLEKCLGLRDGAAF